MKADSVLKTELREFFTGSAVNLKDGSRVNPVLLKEGAIHTEFVIQYLGKSPVSLLLNWRGLVMSGQATMPKSLDSDAEMVEYVGRTPGKGHFPPAKNKVWTGGSTPQPAGRPALQFHVLRVGEAGCNQDGRPRSGFYRTAGARWLT